MSGRRSECDERVIGCSCETAPPTAMKILSWYVRGLGKGRMFQEAQQLLQEHKPQLLFLCETNMTARKMQEKADKLHFQNCFEVSREGLGGELVMMWNSETMMEIKSYNKHHVDAVVHSENEIY